MVINNTEKKGEIWDWLFSLIVNRVILSQTVPQSRERGGKLSTMNSIACQTHGSHKRKIIIIIICISYSGCQAKIQPLRRRNLMFLWSGLT